MRVGHIICAFGSVCTCRANTHYSHLGVWELVWAVLERHLVLLTQDVLVSGGRLTDQLPVNMQTFFGGCAVGMSGCDEGGA